MVCQYGVALESRENMPITVLSPCQLFIFLSREAHVTGQGKEQTSQAVTQHKPMCLERQEYSECYIFTRPVPACWWMHSIEAAFQEKDTGTGLEACQLFCATSPWGRRACPSLSLCRGIPWSRPTAKQSAQSCLRFSKLISEDTIWQKMHCSFGAVTGNLQPSIKPCDGLPTHQFHQQRDTSLSLVWDEFHGTYLQIRGRKTASVKVNSLETSHYWPTSYSFISKSKKIWPIPTAHPPHDIYKQDQPRW